MILNPKTFLDVIASLESIHDRGLTFVQPDGSETRMIYSAVHAEVLSRGRKLLSLGLKKGDRLAMVIPQADDFILSFLGAVSVGVVPVPLYPPLALSKLDTYLDQTARILVAARADMLLTTSRVEKVLWSLVGRAPTVRDLVTVEKLLKQDAAPPPRVTIAPEDPVFLQFTSGSTADPKGVVVTHASLCANCKKIIFEGLRCDDHEVAVSWLPLYHDMGLIGFVLAPLLRPVPVVYIPTLDFVKRPTLWMDVVHRHRGTITFAPNFAFARLAKRSTDADLARWDLSCLKVVGCGAEPIHAGTMRAFLDRMAAAKLRPESLLPCYGMAEATLAMSFVALRDSIKVDAIDADACYEEKKAVPHTNGVASRLELVSCGRPFEGHELGIFDEHGRRLPERHIGEIRHRGPSVAAGYFDNPAATKATFLADGWLRTGDLGYIADGELYISGRQKDILIVHGRNYYPQAIEWLVEEVPGIRKGNGVVFSVPGDTTEEVVVVAETAENDPDKRKKMAHDVKRHLSQAMQLAARDVVLLGVGELPKTTSGKVQRRKTREQYLAGTLGRDGVRTLGSTGQRLQLARHLLVSFASRVGHRAQSLWPWWPMTMFQRRLRSQGEA